MQTRQESISTDTLPASPSSSASKSNLDPTLSDFYHVSNVDFTVQQSKFSKKLTQNSPSNELFLSKNQFSKSTLHSTKCESMVAKSPPPTGKLPIAKPFLQAIESSDEQKLYNYAATFEVGKDPTTKADTLDLGLSTCQPQKAFKTFEAFQKPMEQHCPIFEFLWQKL